MYISGIPNELNSLRENLNNAIRRRIDSLNNSKKSHFLVAVELKRKQHGPGRLKYRGIISPADEVSKLSVKAVIDNIIFRLQIGAIQNTEVVQVHMIFRPC